MTFQEALTLLQQTSPLRITVSGDIGSGKSTFAKHLASDLAIPRIYVGQLMREEAAKRGMTLDAFNALLEQNDAVDREMDALLHEASLNHERGIFEGRMAWHFTEHPNARVFFAVDPAVSAERIWNDKDNHLRDAYASVEELQKANEERKRSEETRYQQYYGLSAYKQENFDIIIDTTHLSIEEVYEKAIQEIATFVAKA